MKLLRLFLVALAFAPAVRGLANTPAKNLWLTNCSECHGKDGRARTDEGKRLKITDLTNKQVQASFTDEQAFRVIKEGIRDDHGPVMHRTSYRLSEDEIKSLVSYVRSLAKR